MRIRNFLFQMMTKKTRQYFLLLLFLFQILPQTLLSQKNGDEKGLNSGLLTGLKFRSIGPAYCSGRIADFAVNPENHSEYYVGVASGNVWKTVNAGTTWKPVFDNYGSYSIADVEIDPNNPNVVWVGTGEYNSQRSVSYGDGVYVSLDGGKSFKNTGLKDSRHIGRIIIDPRNSHVYVAAQGPLWGPGGDRGIYKTTDMGKNWQKVLDVSENTGFNDIVMDPRNPDILYAAAYQRRRHVFTLINGGPESAIYKSEDGGMTWRKLEKGIPNVMLGRIGLAISPANPDIVYASIEAANEQGGFFRSTDRGESWQKMSSHQPTSPQYYQRIVADPKDPGKVFALDTYTHYTLNGGKTFKRLGNKDRHVDDHALWIDPDDTNHYIMGGDGGIYETWDNAGTWHHKPNLPVVQYYRVTVDNDKPFYNVYGGTQDNNSMGGPSQTISSDGIVNADWYVTNGGDGFTSEIDPENPDIVYAQSQYGWLWRYDRKSGESILIKPQPPSGEAYRWNWNSPLIISPHLHTRLYFAANKLFRSDDRGNSWKVISPDLTQQIDRNQLKVMGKIQSPDVPSKNASTSLFGNIVSLDESPKKEGLLYVGTDDGLIQVSDDGGKNWRKENRFGDVPDMTYVSCVRASLFDENTVYASFDARKQNNLKPFIFKSTDKGNSWKKISANLPENCPVFDIEQDHVNPDLLFIGTEYGVYFTPNGGEKWIKLTSGVPVISVKDIDIQRRENDLVLGTFGRGFYILDDYSPLRKIDETIAKPHQLFEVQDALMYIKKRARYGQGFSYYKGENPPFGATFTYYLKESILTKKQKRQKEEKEARKSGIEIDYPGFAELQAEDEEEKPYILFTVTDETGQVVRRLKAPAKKGVHRLTWDLRFPSTYPASEEKNPFKNNNSGSFVLPGTYKVSMAKSENGVITDLGQSQEFELMPLRNTTLPAKDRKALVDFQRKVSETARIVQGTSKKAAQLKKRIGLIRVALHNTPEASQNMANKAKELDDRLNDILISLEGNKSISKRNANQPPAITDRLGSLLWGGYRTTSEPTQTMKDQLKIIEKEYGQIHEKLVKWVNDLKELEKKMEAAHSPWTPGRLPEWE